MPSLPMPTAVEAARVDLLAAVAEMRAANRGWSLAIARLAVIGHHLDGDVTRHGQVRDSGLTGQPK